MSPPSAAINDLTQQVREALGMTGAHDWRSDVDGIESLWSAAIALELRMAPECQEMLDADDIAARALVEVVREGINNAVRHGGADEVHVSVSPCPGGIVCEIRDDGIGVDGTPQPGMGSRLLDAVCMDWSLTRNGGTVLHATIACGDATEDGEARAA